MLVQRYSFFIFKQANDVFLFWILKLFSLFCKAWNRFLRWFFLGFWLSLWTTSILEETNHSSFVSLAAKSSGFQLFSSITFQNIFSTVYLRKRIIPPLFPLLQNSPASSYSPLLLPEYPLNILLEYLRSFLFSCPFWQQATDVLVLVPSSPVTPYMSWLIAFPTVAQPIDSVIELLIAVCQFGLS